MLQPGEGFDGVLRLEQKDVVRLHVAPTVATQGVHHVPNMNLNSAHHDGDALGALQDHKLVETLGDHLNETRHKAST